MSLQEIDFSKTLNDDQVYNTIMGNYSHLSKEWIFSKYTLIKFEMLPMTVMYFKRA